MKTTYKIFILSLVFTAFFSCKDQFTEVFTANAPIYMSYEDLRVAVKMNAPRELENPGKIYFKDGYIFINEELKGIHIIDNRNPASPQNLGFIDVPGNVDIAVKNNILYADSYIDLVAIDIADVNNPSEVSRVKDIFPYTTPPYDDDYRVAQVDPEKGVVIGWEIKRVRQEMEYHYYPVYFHGRAELAMSDGGFSGGDVQNGSTFGVGGSMARFGLYNDYLYAVDNSTLFLFDVKTDGSPNSIGKQSVGWNIETMFIYDGHMFFGTQNGMLIYSLEVATVPKYIGQFWHVTACDPVVVADGYAYVTLKGGNVCGSNVNRLDVLSLSPDYRTINLIQSYPMNGPNGLGIDGDLLFVCDGDAGLKVYNASDKLHIDDNMIARFPNINTYDVIPVGGFLFMIGDDGFYQYDYSNIQDIRQISFIPVNKDN
jgi:hypothetical protein